MSFKGLNDNKVTIECGLSVGLLGKARSGKSDLGDKAIEKILNIYQDLNHVWLLTGEGSMLKTTDQPVSQSDNDVTPTETGLNNPQTMERFFKLIEDQQRQTRELAADLREERLNRKEEVSRFLSLIEKMQGIAGAGVSALKKGG